MTYCQQMCTNTSIFPTRYGKNKNIFFKFNLFLFQGQEFKSKFIVEAKKILNYLWAILCHIYHRHFDQCKQINIEPQVEFQIKIRSKLYLNLKFLTSHAHDTILITCASVSRNTIREKNKFGLQLFLNLRNIWPFVVISRFF